MVIVKAPTKHGLDRKFKPWRRGKSEKSNKRSSLKHELRGIERLLQKLPDHEKERREQLEQKIQSLKQEIQEKQKIIEEKKHAEKAHGQRFLDRQRLTRQEKQARKQNDTAAIESQLFKIALDQVYVAHHPNDVKYMPLFRKAQRVVDTSRHLYRRAVTRRRILNSLTKDKQNCSWISKEQYGRLPTVEWTIQDEERIFGGSITRQGTKEIKQKLQKSKDDSRFVMAPQHETLLQAADQVNAELDEVKEVGDDTSNEGSSSHHSDMDRGTLLDESANGKKPSKPTKRLKADPESDDSSSDSDDDSDGDDPLNRLKKADGTNAPKSDNTEDSDSDSDSSDSSEEEGDHDQDLPKNTSKPKDDKKSDSSDSSDESDSDEMNVPKEKHDNVGNAQEEENEVDDFLVDPKGEEDENIFSMTLKQVPALGDFRGDKSKGWETQRQRPGQFKKRRVRR